MVWYSASKAGHSFLNEAFLEEERENMAARFIPDSETRVFERDGHIIGFIALDKNEVGGLFVDAAAHRTGVGQALIDHALSTRSYLELDVFGANLPG